MPDVTFIYPIIKTTQIERSLFTLYRYTDHNKFRVIVIDQSIEGFSGKWYDKVVDHGGLVIAMKNGGFAKAANEGIIHGLKWQTPYISVVNDDTEFMHSSWFEDALLEFDTDPHIVAVCPESPRVAGWGYGLTHGINIDILPYKEEFTQIDIEYLKKGDYDPVEIQSRHTFKIPESFPMTKRGVIDGIAMWCPIFKREAFIELGLFEERFVWGGGEDYDMLARAYSCAYPIPRDECDPIHHRRMVSTMRSWVWHDWGQSKDVKEKLNPKLFEKKEPWNNGNSLWEPNLEVWGHVNGKPVKRIMPVLTA